MNQERTSWHSGASWTARYPSLPLLSIDSLFSISLINSFIYLIQQDDDDDGADDGGDNGGGVGAFTEGDGKDPSHLSLSKSIQKVYSSSPHLLILLLSLFTFFLSNG